MATSHLGDMLLLASISIAAALDVINETGQWDSDLGHMPLDDKQ